MFEISGLDFSPNKSSPEPGIRHKIFFLRSVDRLARLEKDTSNTLQFWRLGLYENPY